MLLQKPLGQPQSALLISVVQQEGQEFGIGKRGGPVLL